MESNQPRIVFPDVDPATAGRFARELREQLLDASGPEAKIDADLERDDPEALDAGSMILLGVHVLTPFVAHVVASTLFEWAKWRKTKIRVKNGVFEMNVDYRAGDACQKRLVKFLTDQDDEGSVRELERSK